MATVTVIVNGEEVSSTESIFGDTELVERTADMLNERNLKAYSKDQGDD
jgi:hypothetical protein